MGVRQSTPPTSPKNPTIHISPDHQKTPEKQPKNVEEPPSASKKATTSSSSHGFPKIPHDLGPGPIGLDDVGDLFMKEIEDHTEVIDQLGDELEERNEALKKEIEALRADRVIKDDQLNMLYTVIKHKLGFNVQVVFDEIEIQRVEARRVEREKRLAEEAA
ncbi:hypothetical protein Hanom_Chr10g00925581 [Helianthus anomalus]